MPIPRSLAFALAGTVLAAACHVYVREPYAEVQPAPPRPPAVVRHPPPAEPASPHPPRAHARATVAPPEPPAAMVGVTSTDESPAGPAISASAASPRTAYPQSACLDTGMAPVGDCSAIKLPDSSCHHASAALRRCNAYKTYFDPKVGALTVSCLASLTSKQVCDASQPLVCAKTALAQACPDPSVVQLCQIAATSCKITPGECSALLSGLNDSGQQAIAQCVADGCPTGLGGCIDGLAERTERAP